MLLGVLKAYFELIVGSYCVTFTVQTCHSGDISNVVDPVFWRSKTTSQGTARQELGEIID